MNKNKNCDKYKEYLEIVYWMYKRKDLPNKIHSFIREGNYKEIVVYGIGMVGEMLVEYLEYNNVDIAYCLDKYAERVRYDATVLYPDEVKSSTDLIIIVPIIDAESIKVELKKYTQADIITVEDLIYLI